MPLTAAQAVGNDKGSIREHWGIPNSNTMETVRIGLMRSQDISNSRLVTVRRAHEYDGYKGGGPEYFINNRALVPLIVVPLVDHPF